jgi:hypothetical protein
MHSSCPKCVGYPVCVCTFVKGRWRYVREGEGGGRRVNSCLYSQGTVTRETLSDA